VQTYLCVHINLYARHVLDVLRLKTIRQALLFKNKFSFIFIRTSIIICERVTYGRKRPSDVEKFGELTPVVL
jgi:hypothetical protein